jgi:hypothetical protein
VNFRIFVRSDDGRREVPFEFHEETDERGDILPIYILIHILLLTPMKIPVEVFPKPQTHLIQRILVVVELLSITMLMRWQSPLMKKEWLASAVNRSRDIERSIDGSPNNNLTSA